MGKEPVRYKMVSMKKNNAKNYYLIIVLFILIFLVSCSANDCNWTCVQITNISSYPLDEWTSENEKPGVVKATALGWKVVYSDPNLGNAKQVITRGDNQIWILGTKLFRFTKNDNELMQVNIEWNGISSTPMKLFLAHDNSLWAIGSQAKEKVPLLFKWNDNLNQFDPIIDKQELLMIEGQRFCNIVEDSKDQFWIAYPNNGLFVFDQGTLIAQKIISTNDGVEITSDGLAIDKNDGLWISIKPVDQYATILFFNTRDLSSTQFSIGKYIDYPINGLLVDSKDRLWISDYAFWEIGTPFPGEGYSGLNKVIRSTVFLSQRVPFEDYQWLIPKVIFEDKLGNIWFTSYGLVKFNPETGEWCRVYDSISYELGVTEDNSGLIWVVEDGVIYKH